MTNRQPSWWNTAADIAGLALPGVPKNKRSVHEKATLEGWAAKLGPDGLPLARPRVGKGGGIEYHASLLPAQAQEVLSARIERAQVAPIAANDVGADRNERDWAWYDQQSVATKAEAARRLLILTEIEASVSTGTGRTSATLEASRRHDKAAVRTINDWFAAVKGFARANWLLHLAPDRKGGGKEVAIDPGAWQFFLSDFLRPENPSLASCYTRLLEDYARERGITVPDVSTFQRRLKKKVPKTLITDKRRGREYTRRSVPPQQRTVADLHALEAVNVDGHTFDVFVEWEDGRVGRPVMVGIQDVFSRKLLAYRIGETESTLLTRLAFADLFRDYGIPLHAVMDNGRAFASKALTGGALTRFRFKIKDTDATGVLTALGMKVHWTLPYRGSSKPIERAWRDLCDGTAKHPRVAGAYTGNKPDAKPENYRERAIPIAEFREHVADQIAKHNAREGRRTEMALGGSFDTAFADSYAVAPIGKAHPEQLRLALLEAIERPCNRETGAVTLAGNVYWSPAMIEIAGEKVTVRFDPDNYHQDVHIYRRDGRYFGIANVIQATGFFDKSGAEKRAKMEKNLRRAVRVAEEAADLLRVDQLAELLSGPTTPAPMPEAGVVRPVRHRGNTAAALKPIQQAEHEHAPAAPSFSDNFAAAVARLRVVE